MSVNIVTKRPDELVAILIPDFITRPEFAAGGAPHNVLSATHTDSAAAAVVDGDVIIGNVAPAWSRLAISIPAANVRNVLGVDNGELRPSWKTALDAVAPTTIAPGDAPAAGTSLIFAHRDHTHGAPATFPAAAHNLLSATHGDTAVGAVADGDVVIGNVTPAWSRLAISVPAANVRNVFGVDNGELRPSWKAALDGNNPVTLTVSTVAAPGTSLIFSHRDHAHAVTTSSNPGAAAAILASSAAGALTLVDLTLSSLTASTVVYSDAAKKIVSLANAAGYLTNNGAGALSWSATAAPTAHALLSASHDDTVAAAPVRGDLIVGNVTPAWTKLALGGAAGSILTRDATDPLWSDYYLAGSAGHTYTFPDADGTVALGDAWKLGNVIVVSDSGDGDYTTLAAAFAAAVAGNTVILDIGTYAGGVTVPDGVSLVGVDKHRCIVSTAADVSCLTVGNGAYVTNLTVYNNNAGAAATYGVTVGVGDAAWLESIDVTMTNAHIAGHCNGFNLLDAGSLLIYCQVSIDNTVANSYGYYCHGTVSLLHCWVADVPVGYGIYADESTPLVRGGSYYSSGGTSVYVLATKTLTALEMPYFANGKDGAGAITGAYQTSTAVVSEVPVDLDGVADALVLDADGDTSIAADTDNQIDFEANNADQVHISDGMLWPDVDNDIDLGDPTHEFKDGYFDGTVNADAVDLDGNADALILDADGDTTIAADTDDQIDVEIGGADIFVMVPTALKSAGSVHPTLGTTTAAEKWGNIYQALSHDILPDNDNLGLWSRYVNYNRTPDEHWHQNADDLVWTGWAAYTGFVTPATITRTNSRLTVDNNAAAKAFYYRSYVNAQTYLYSRLSLSFAVKAGLMVDDGVDNVDGNGANNFYRVYLESTASGTNWRMGRQYRTGGGGVTTTTYMTLNPDIYYGLVLLYGYGTRWASWGALTYTYGEPGELDVLDSAVAAAAWNWTPARIGLYWEISAGGAGQKAIWDHYEEA